MRSFPPAVADPIPHFSCPRVSEIQHAICNRFGVSLMELTSDRRPKYLVRPRQLGMYLARHLTQRSYPEIGRYFGGRDHTTVMYAVRKIDELRAQDPTINSDVLTLSETITNAAAERMATIALAEAA